MILDKSYYVKISFLRSLWNLRQFKKIAGEKVFKAFKLHKTELKTRPYFYSPRLKKVPRFTGNTELLTAWKEAKICEAVCPTQVIKVSHHMIEIDERGCILCGLCIEVSPPGILEMNSGN